MKTQRRHSQGTRNEQRMVPKRDDSYRDDAKRPDPATCPRCRATYLKGRWTWVAAPEGAEHHTCPACKRIEEGMPAGYLTITGEFALEHRAEILALVQARARRARVDHPMQRVIGIEDTAQNVVVTTTDAHLARSLGSALHDAYKGELDLGSAPGENLARATWTR